MQDGAFDEAVKGVDAIEHIASPCRMYDDPQGDLRFLNASDNLLTVLHRAD